jgi:hypothetical protein
MSSTDTTSLNIFNPFLVESMDAEPTNIEGLLYKHRNLFSLRAQISLAHRLFNKQLLNKRKKE